ISTDPCWAETELKMRVKPGDYATIYCDCTYQSKFTLVWIIKPSNEHQPPLINLTEDTTPPRYSRVWNDSRKTFDMLVKNITESDLGLYYCALHEVKLTRKEFGARFGVGEWVDEVRDDVIMRKTEPRSSLSGSSPVLAHCNQLAHGTTLSYHRVSGEEVEVKVRPGDNAVLYGDCAWKHGFSTVWFRNSSHEHMVIHNEAHPRYSIVWIPFSKTSDLLVRNVSESDLGLYYCALHKTQPTRDKALACSGEDVCLYGNRTTRLSFHSKVGGDDVCYASLDLPGRGERRLKKKKRVECSELGTYSEDTAWSKWIHRLDNTTNTSVSNATLVSSGVVVVP
ncbi:hypothetical protein NFI96_009824, partial [Prochilodus magdalenae]